MVDDHPNEKDFANKREHDAARLDEWRVEQARRITGKHSGMFNYNEYRRLVREDVRP